MMGDFMVTAMYFGVSFSAAPFIVSKVMIWLFGIWILGMLLAPFNQDRTILKKGNRIWLIGCSRNPAHCTFHSFFARISIFVYSWNDGNQYFEFIWSRSRQIIGFLLLTINRHGFIGVKMKVMRTVSII